MKRLILHQIDETFDPETDLPVGPWCFVGAEDIYPEWHKLDFIDALGSVDVLDQTDRATRRLVAWQIDKWANKLNRRHGVNHSLQYWRFVLIAWMLAAVQGLWVRFLQIQAIVERHGNEALDVAVAPLSPPVQFADFFDFQHHQRRNPNFDYWENGLIVRKLAPDNWTLIEPAANTDWSELSGFVDAPPFVSNEQYSRLGNLARRIFGRLRFDSVPGTRASKILFSLYLMLLPARGRGETFYQFEKENVPDEFPEIFIELLDGFLDATLPQAYDAGYPELEAKAKDRKTHPGRLFIGNYMPSDEAVRLELAHALEDGEKFISIQHGGGYGVARHNSWAADFEYALHGFISWGWTGHSAYPGRYIPLPSPLLNKFRDKHKERTAKLAMVATKTDIRDVRPFGPRPLDWIAYRNLKIEFLEALEAKPKAELVYYAYRRGSSDLDDVGFLKTHFEDLKVADSGLNDDMLSARLLLLDHPGTTLHIALAANVPTVCYWDPDTWHLSDQAVPYFELLEKSGIIFDSPQKAAQHVNKIWHDVNAWWQGSDVQNARVAWSQNFARTDRFWWWAWIKALTKLQLSGQPV